MGPVWRKAACAGQGRTRRLRATSAIADGAARPRDGALAPRAAGDRHAARGRAGAPERDPYFAAAGRVLSRNTASVMSAAAVPHVIAETIGSLKSVPPSNACANTSAKATYARR